MSNKNKIKQELEEYNSPILARWQGEAEEWSMPDDYLQKLMNDVVENKGGRKIIFNLFNPSTIRRIAAALLFLLMGTWLFIDISSTTTTSPLANLDEISTEEIQAYVMENIDDFDLDLLENYAPSSYDEVVEDYNETEEEWLNGNTTIDLF